MATAQMDRVIRHLRRAVLRQDRVGWTDGQLLASFIDQKDEGAFEALVRRHGPMVFGVCRRVLRNHHDAEDAFQATFLVLARKASLVRPRERLANWLHGVALRTAMKAKTITAKRKGREKRLTEMRELEATQQEEWRDLQTLLDQELNGLPQNYRLPILLCDLEGKSIKQATQQLGWPQGTLAGRLARGRKLLAKRLANRGVVLSAGSLAAVVSQNVASAGVPTSLVSFTVKAASLVAAGQMAVAGVVPVKVAALMEGAMKAMLITKLKTVTVALLVVAAVGIGGGVLSRSTTAAAETADEPLPEAAGEHRASRSAGQEFRVEAVPGAMVQRYVVTFVHGGTVDQQGEAVETERSEAKTSEPEYKSIFVKTLGVMAGHFEQITYANQYDGRIEASTNAVDTTGMIRQGYVSLSCQDGKCFLTVRVNKVRTTGDKSEVIGRDAELERVILTKLNAQSIQKRLQPKDEQRRKTLTDESTSQEIRPPKAADQREYVIMSRLLEGGADQPKEVFVLPKMTIDEGQPGALRIMDGMQKLPAKVRLDEKFKVGTFFDVQVQHLEGNKVRLFVSFQRNEVDKSSVSEIRVLGNKIAGRGLSSFGTSLSHADWGVRFPPPFRISCTSSSIQMNGRATSNHTLSALSLPGGR
jgi:RNA polymerase sigma factor (sigma-70 family)